MIDEELGKSAWKDEDLFSNTPPESFALTEKGLLSEKETEVAFADSPHIFWQIHENKLWFAIIIFSLWFVMILIG